MSDAESRDGRNAFGLVRRADAAYRLRRFEQAAELARQSMAIDATDRHGYTMLAAALIRLERFDEALQAADAGLSRAPGSALLHTLSSRALRGLGEVARGLEAAREAVRLEPGQAWVHSALGTSLAESGMQDEALAAHERALRIAPDDPAIREAAAFTLLGTKPTEAERHFRAALSADPMRPGSLNGLGVALQALRRPLEAAYAFQAAVKLDPKLSLPKKNLKAALDLVLFPTPIVVTGLVMLLGTIALAVWSLWAAGFLAGLVLAIGMWVVNQIAGDGGLARRLRKLEKRDPQLYEIYERLTADNKSRR